MEIVSLDVKFPPPSKLMVKEGVGSLPGDDEGESNAIAGAAGADAS